MLVLSKYWELGVHTPAGDGYSTLDAYPYPKIRTISKTYPKHMAEDATFNQKQTLPASILSVMAASKQTRRTGLLSDPPISRIKISPPVYTEFGA